MVTEQNTLMEGYNNISLCEVCCCMIPKKVMRFTFKYRDGGTWYKKMNICANCIIKMADEIKNGLKRNQKNEMHKM